MTIVFGKSEIEKEDLDKETADSLPMLPVKINGRKRYISPDERKSLIFDFKNEIEKLKHWYLDSESREVGDILVFDTKNVYSSPKTMTFNEREKKFNKKRTMILKKLKSLKWKHKLCNKCKKYKKQKDFRLRKDICQDCYSKLLKSRKEKIEKKFVFQS